MKNLDDSQRTHESTDSIANDDTYKIESEFKERLKSAEDYEEWREKYGPDPVSFFDPRNLDSIRNIDASKRIAFFGWSSRYLGVSPSDADLYFNAFPEDLRAISNMMHNNYYPRNTVEYGIYGLSASRVYEPVDHEDNQRTYLRNKWPQTCALREKAPYHILSNYRNDTHYAIDNFGEASSGYGKLFDKANKNPLGLRQALETKSMFSADSYLALSPQEKTRLLRLCLAHLQYCLVFNETNNFVITKEQVERDNARLKARGAHRPSHSYNVSHSMLFGTFQPSSSYDLAQSVFEFKMNGTANIGGAVEEYPFHKMLLEVLHEYRRQAKHCTADDIKLIVEFWDKNRNPIFANAVAYVLSEADPNLASQELLTCIKNSSGERNALVAILYRIEFGRLGISKEGVRYLNRMYDLTEFNNPNYFVQRLSPDGEMGIFDGDNQLIKYFKVGNISDEQAHVRADVLDFAYEVLFASRPGETDREKSARIKYLEEFRKNYFNITTESVFSTDIRANNFSLKDQGVAIIAMHEMNDETKDNLQDLINIHGESLLRIFLRFYALDARIACLAVNTIRQCNKPEDQQNIVSILLEMIRFISNIETEYNQALSDSKYYDDESGPQKPRYLVAKEKIIPEVRKTIMARLEKALTIIAQQPTSENVRSATLSIAPHALMVETIMKVSRGNFEEVNFHEMPLLRRITFEGNTHSLNERTLVSKLQAMYRANYADKPKLLQRLLDSFNRIRENDRAEIEVVYLGEEPIAFCAFEYDEKEKVLHFGKFNVNPEFAGRQLGEQILEETLDDYAHTQIIKAECDRDARITSKYLERGFIATTEYPLDEIQCWDIYRNDSMNSELETKALDEEYIINHSVIGEWSDIDINGEKGQAKVFSVFESDLKGQKLNYLSQHPGYVVTRMPRRKTEDPKGDMVFIVIEKTTKQFLNDYKTKFTMPQVMETRHAIIV